MKALKTGVMTLALIAAGSLGAMAQSNDYSTGVAPQTPDTRPSTVTPSPNQGASSGDTGVNAPAGIPADPTTNENVQPGPSTNTPNDPAAGSNPSARVPSSPEGTGSSSP